jgi:hypothetical protein
MLILNQIIRVGDIIILHTETVGQVRVAVDAARFPPLGHHCFPPFMCSPSVVSTSLNDIETVFSVLPGVEDGAPAGKTWFDVTNEPMAIIPQIESHLGVENLEEIMQVKGVDAISAYCLQVFTSAHHNTVCEVVGPGDPQMDLRSDTMLMATKECIKELATKYKMLLTGFIYENTLAEKYKVGYCMTASTANKWSLANGIKKSLGTHRKMIEEARKDISKNEEADGETR